MSKIISMFVALMLCAAFASSVHAEFRWKNPGADPYAPSREEAMKTRESAFRKLGFPEPVVELLVEATKVPGKKVKLEMGSRLAAMLSNGGAVHKDVVIDWKAPIRGTELVAPAEMWQVAHEGKIYTAFLFDVCNNWSSVIASAPTASALPPVAVATAGCVEIHFTTKPGDMVVRFALMGPAPVADDCVGVKRKGSVEFERLWKNECPDEHCGFRAPSQVVGQPVQLMGSYVPEPGEHVLRLPAFVAAKDSKYVTGICIDWVKMPWPEKPMVEYTHARRDEYIALRNEYIAQRDKWIAWHSDTIGVRWHDYEKTQSGTVAQVYYTLDEVPAGKPKLYIPRGDWAKDPEKHRQYWNQAR